MDYIPHIGDEVSTTHQENVTGIIGEIMYGDNESLYIWQNEWDGARVERSPSAAGYKYSWCVPKPFWNKVKLIKRGHLTSLYDLVKKIKEKNETR